ncbi:MAG TPA: asparagine synthase (glutamine-hydrolyzing) [Terriglobales bacterium]|nr:asparagine synthase (glutamine-hydrolyzing) [Terriglobales bacterium]
MCGIAGFTHKNWVPDVERIRSATATLVHRGPDQQGVFESNLVSLGATRLKIIDLGSGDQPITAADTTIVFNGEIYNHRELRAELEAMGHQFLSHCDTETVLHAFLEWDVGCFARLRGMFALALWNQAERRLLLARDRMGIKPLFFARHGEDLFFGSELKAIFVHPEIERRLSLEGLDCYLSLNYVPCPWTLVEGLEKLPPGQWMEWRDGKVSTHFYWTLPLPEPRERGLEEAKEELDWLLRQSIREHLISDVPLGMWLSGGIDSSTILHYASTESSAPLKTFSISFRGRNFDESRYIQQVAEHYHTEHSEIDLNPAVDLEGAVEEFAYYCDEPSADAGALPVWFLSQLSKTRTTVTLSGEGADEIFAGYLTHRANLLAVPMRWLPASATRLGLRAMRHWPVSDEKIGLEYKAVRFLEGSLMAADRGHVHWNGTFSDPEKYHLIEPRLPSSLHRSLRELRSLLRKGDRLSSYLWFDQKYFLPDDILTKTDRMSMAHSLEVRPPFLDHRIVEFSATLPARLKLRGSRQKFVLKELMRGKLPASIPNRKKIGFDIPAHDWLRGPLRPLLVDTLNRGASDHAWLFRPGVIKSYLDEHLERRANLGYHLWGLMVLFLWMNKWRIRTASAAAGKEWMQERTGTYM